MVLGVHRELPTYRAMPHSLCGPTIPFQIKPHVAAGISKESACTRAQLDTQRRNATPYAPQFCLQSHRLVAVSWRVSIQPVIVATIRILSLTLATLLHAQCSQQQRTPTYGLS